MNKILSFRPIRRLFSQFTEKVVIPEYYKWEPTLEFGCFFISGTEF